MCHVAQQKGNPLVFRRIAIRAHQRKNPIGLVGIRGPDLLAVDQVMIAFVFCFGLNIGQIRPGTGFGIALTPTDFASCDWWKILHLLGFAAKGQNVVCTKTVVRCYTKTNGATNLGDLIDESEDVGQRRREMKKIFSVASGNTKATSEEKKINGIAGREEEDCLLKELIRIPGVQ